MIRVHVLTEPINNQNTAAFLAPLLWNAPALARTGIRLRVFTDPRSVGECDVVAVNSKFWSGDWALRRDEALALLEGLQHRRVYFFDRTSSPGFVNGDVLSVVDGYYKAAAYSDRRLYERPVYGGRLFAEYYRDTAGITDAQVPFTPPTLTAAQAAQVKVAWNTGLVSYGLAAPRLASLHRLLPLRAFLAPPHRFTAPSHARPIAVSCRMALRYSYATIAYQRQRVAQILAPHRRTERVSKLAYVRELRRSRVVASPFGYSEINYKDFETFQNGAVLLKPDVSHLETWPDYFHAGKTYVNHRWDLSDVAARIDEVLSDYDRFLAVARAGQETYRWHASHPDGHAAFRARFRWLIGAA